MAQKNNNVCSYLAFEFNKKYKITKENDLVKPGDLEPFIDINGNSKDKKIILFGKKSYIEDNSLIYSINKKGKLYENKILVFPVEEKDTRKFENVTNSKEFTSFLKKYYI